MLPPTLPLPLPEGLERPHFIGIGGSGMSGIAKLLIQRGAHVSGSDRDDNDTTQALRSLGATVAIGHAAAHLPSDATSVVISSAIGSDNPELLLADRGGLPVIHRSTALAGLMASFNTIAVAGTHGKTTTTSMLATVLTAMDKDISYVIGADLDVPGSGAHQGQGKVFVAEADESDHSFHAYRPHIAVVLNIEFEHHANYASLEDIYTSFETFVKGLTSDGTLVASADQPGARELARRVLAGSAPPRVVTYGESAEADVRILDISLQGAASTVTVRADQTITTFSVSVPGRHYAHNAVAALAAGLAYGFPLNQLAPALAAYTGAKRRLEHKGEAAGIQVVDTYAHHPTEMVADLTALRQAHRAGRLLVAYQPHLYSRTKALAEAMGQALALADISLVLDIYPAREDPIPGVSSQLIVDAARTAGADTSGVLSLAETPTVIAELARCGDLIVTMGGGDITLAGPQILRHLAARASAR